MESGTEDFRRIFDTIFMDYLKAYKRSWQQDELKGGILKSYFRDIAGPTCMDLAIGSSTAYASGSSIYEVRHRHA
jgi:hypothetical protein